MKRLALALMVVLCPAALLEAGDRYRKSLFNGKDLSGWTVTNCEAGVEEGLLVVQKGNGFVRSDHRYRDFVLEWEYRPRKEDKWDSGVYVRCEAPAKNKPWPRRYQINLQQGREGNLIGNKQGESKGLINAGQWNRMKLTVVGETAEMEINGKPAWKAGGIETSEGFIGLQVEVPGGGQFEFREIYVTEIGHRALFNGKDMAGWEGAGQEASKCWKVEDGMLVCTGEKGPWLRSKEQFGDFNLRLEYRVKPGGNSGVYVRVPKSGNHHGKDSGVEVQVLDDHADRYKNLKPYQFSASVYDFAGAEPRVSRPAGQWNTLEIDCRGDSYRVAHNGLTVTKADEKSHPMITERLKKGFLGLQNHSEEVWFRHVRLGPSTQN